MLEKLFEFIMELQYSEVKIGVIKHEPIEIHLGDEEFNKFIRKANKELGKENYNGAVFNVEEEKEGMPRKEQFMEYKTANGRTIKIINKNGTI